MADHVYQNLANEEIRLLRLLPSRNFHDPIQIHIFHQPFSAKPNYQALSYVWGSEEDPASISIANKSRWKAQNTEWKTLLITRNLEIALRHLRLRDVRRTMWIDAICINQKHLAEKNKEVARMGEIYKNARRVIIFLGPEGENSNSAIRWMKRISQGPINLHPSLSYFQKITWLCNYLFGNPSDRRWTSAYDEELRENYRDEYIAINQVLKRAWFSRLWVCQEAHLATKATVVVGRTTIPWSDFRYAVAYINALTFQNVDGPLTKWFDIKNLRQVLNNLWIYNVKHPSMRTILIVTKHLDCSDPRDRFYAILGLLGYELKVDIDYSSSVENIYRNFGLAAIQKEGLNVLELCTFQETKVPSWSLDPSFASQPLPLSMIYMSKFDAGGMIDLEAQQKTSELDDVSFMIHGVLVDEVTYVTSHCPSDIELKDIGSLLSIWKTQVEERLPSVYITGGSSLEAFASTLVASCFRQASRDKHMADELCVTHLCKILNGNEDVSNSWYKWAVREYITGHSIFITKKGYIGLSLPSILPKDKVFIAIGKTTPLILRSSNTPRPLGDEREYTESCRIIAGDSYVHGIMNREILLGPIPLSWNFEWAELRDRDGTRRPVYVHENGKQQQEDPRLQQLPSNWVIRYKKSEKDGVVEWAIKEYDRAGEMLEIYFIDMATGKAQHWDPRLSPDSLRARGVSVEKIRLV